MPNFASKKQYRMMMAILHGKKGTTARGDEGPPKSIAEKYSGKGKDLPDSKGKEHKGGRWDKKGEKRKRKVSKSDSSGVGVIVVNDEGKILIGRSPEKGWWALPGGGIDEGETAKEAAIRELKEETGLSARDAEHFGDDNFGSQFVVLSYSGNLSSSDELVDLQFVDVKEIPWSKLRNCCVPALSDFISSKLKKSKKLSDMVYLENLHKNIIRSSQVAHAVYEMTHGDALKLIGNKTFRILRDGVRGMENDDVKEIPIGTYKLVARKNANDIYSGHIVDGHKTIHNFVNRSLPALTAELMSVFEWYLPEDIPDLEIEEDDKLPDEVIDSGIEKMINNYRHYNLADIYDEMESIREEVRHGTAVDVQQVEERLGKLIDKIEDKLNELSMKHNSLARSVGSDLDELEAKLKELKSSVPSDKGGKPVIAAVDGKPNVGRVLEQYYCYLSKPSVTIEPNGRIKISFDQDWSDMDRGNFLSDLKARVVKK